MVECMRHSVFIHFSFSPSPFFHSSTGQDFIISLHSSNMPRLWFGKPCSWVSWFKIRTSYFKVHTSGQYCHAVQFKSTFSREVLRQCVSMRCGFMFENRTRSFAVWT
uniref:Uncharacterized protein n=1 Tax=Rhipicephalus microplus TaxID=6941 RepID=A0A6G5AGH2_RHIMP